MASTLHAVIHIYREGKRRGTEGREGEVKEEEEKDEEEEGGEERFNTSNREPRSRKVGTNVAQVNTVCS